MNIGEQRNFIGWDGSGESEKIFVIDDVEVADAGGRAGEPSRIPELDVRIVDNLTERAAVGAEGVGLDREALEPEVEVLSMRNVGELVLDLVGDFGSVTQPLRGYVFAENGDAMRPGTGALVHDVGDDASDLPDVVVTAGFVNFA